MFWVLSLCCSAVALYLLLTLENQQKDIGSSYLSYVQAIKLSDELRQSSDDLTRFVRAYAATGDAAYERRFQTVLGIRDGSVPRPAGYDKAYWDLDIVGVADSQEDGDARPLRDRLIDAGLDAESIGDLADSEKLSGNLSKIEGDAFDFVKRGEFRHALELLYSKEYHQIKSRIMIPINRVQARVEKKGEKQLQRLLERYHDTQTTVIALVLASLIFSAVAGLFRRQVIRLHLENDESTELQASSK